MLQALLRVTHRMRIGLGMSVEEGEAVKYLVGLRRGVLGHRRWRTTAAHAPVARQEVLHHEFAGFGPARWCPGEVSDKQPLPFVLFSSNSE